jgi:hypothetical protein
VSDAAIDCGDGYADLANVDATIDPVQADFDGNCETVITF